MRLVDIDNIIEKKGQTAVLIWQFAKFSFVSLIVAVVGYGLLNLIPLIPKVKELYAVPFDFFVFDYPVNHDVNGKVISGGFGYFIAFNVSNVAAQIVAFFVNKEKTFNSCANIAVALPIYIVVTIVLICFSAWFSPIVNTFLTESWHWGGAISRNISTFVCSTIQFFLYFPVDKLLFKQKKEDKVK